MTLTRFRYAAIPLLLTLCGCQAVKDARDAQSASDRLPGETTITAAQAGLLGPQAYALTNLEQIALSAHPSVLQARQSVESARLQCRITHAGRLPQVSASGGYNRSTQNSGRNTSTAMSGSWSGSIGLDLLLYDFGRLEAQERQALETLVSAEEQLRATELDVVYDVRSAFFELHRSAELYRVALETEKQYGEHLEEARVMVEIGTRRRYDATKAEVDWGNAALDVITVSNALVSARAQLNRTLGLAEYPSYAVLPDLMPPRTDLSVSNLMEQARQNDPSLAVLHAKARAASAYVDQTIADLYPSLSLGADLSESGRDFPMTWNFSWALRATQNLFDGHKKTDRIRAAVTDLRSARARVADAEQELFLNLVNAVAQFKSARKRREIAELVERQAAENRDIVNEQYRVGVSSAIERTDAQVAVTQSQADAVRARYDEQAAEARLARLTGAPVGAEATPPPAAAP